MVVQHFRSNELFESAICKKSLILSPISNLSKAALWDGSQPILHPRATLFNELGATLKNLIFLQIAPWIPKNIQTL